MKTTKAIILCKRPCSVYNGVVHVHLMTTWNHSFPGGGFDKFSPAKVFFNAPLQTFSSNNTYQLQFLFDFNHVLTKRRRPTNRKKRIIYKALFEFEMSTSCVIEKRSILNIFSRYILLGFIFVLGQFEDPMCYLFLFQLLILCNSWCSNLVK